MNSTEKAKNQVIRKNVPPAPIVSIMRKYSRNNYAINNGTVVTSFDISWDMPNSPQSSKVKLFEIYITMQPIDGWKLIGSTLPLTLPMTANICNIREETHYKVAVKAIDIHNRPGPLSDYINILVLERD